MVLKYKDIHSFDSYKTMKIIYSMYRAGAVSVHRACCERATQPMKMLTIKIGRSLKLADREI